MSNSPAIAIPPSHGHRSDRIWHRASVIDLVDLVLIVGLILPGCW